MSSTNVETVTVAPPIATEESGASTSAEVPVTKTSHADRLWRSLLPGFTSSWTITRDELRTALEHEKTDKGQWSKTGGGNWCPTITEHDQKVLAILKDQVTRLPNSSDSAAFYFKDHSGDIFIDLDEPNVLVPADEYQGTGSNENEVGEQLESEGNMRGSVRFILLTYTDMACYF
ncbi:uncharacterized protein LOC123313028 [Coccinella septempunctata]|uniref:uncharacterized protein LOC123313028 n=1 Tax=Coccinella septempunctata TaxID=41139 RepID=UPI001D07D7FF|nr:uncharacterized protein LOC123313028 [Coccinella septempunctata]